MDVIAATREPGCHCEDETHMSRLGYGTLHAGMTLRELGELGSGCTKDRWVCPRLDKVRRRYGR